MKYQKAIYVGENIVNLQKRINTRDRIILEIMQPKGWVEETNS